MANGATFDAGEAGEAGAKRGVQALKLLAWGGIVFFALRFWLRDAVPYFEISETVYQGYWPRWNWLLFHIVGGTLALLLGPFQFWTGLRRKHMQFHRWTGRLYVLGVAIAASGAFYLAVNTDFGWSFGLGLFTMATAWVVVTGMALLAVLRRNITAHKQWMIRSYVVTFAFVSFRFVQDIEAVQALGTPEEVIAMLSWTTWAIPLLVTELVFNIKRDRLLQP